MHALSRLFFFLRQMIIYEFGHYTCYVVLSCQHKQYFQHCLDF